jgi:diguanylate cyclase (GGDEF)-like protein
MALDGTDLIRMEPPTLQLAGEKGDGWIDGLTDGRSRGAAPAAFTPTGDPVGDRETVDRRIDHRRRKRIERMSRAELIRELMTDAVTGLPNRRAYEETDRKAYQALLDLDSLKWVNDNFGHAAGDAMLCTVAAALRAAAIEAYRIGGDELCCQFDTNAEGEARLAKVSQWLQNATFSFQVADGTVRSCRGIGISYGVARSLVGAELAQMKAKQHRQATGLRSPRGERPPQLVEVV